VRCSATGRYLSGEAGERAYNPPPMAYRVTLIPGDGTGPELTEATRRVLEATEVEFEWDVRHAGVDVMEEAGTPLPEDTLASIKQNKVALKGPITTPIGTGFRSVNVALRHELGLYACLRPCKSYAGVRSRYENVDVVIVRENTEDLYAGIEYEAGTGDAHDVIAFLNTKQAKQIAPSSGISIKPISPEGSERIARYAFEYARAHGRRQVACITKANIMKFTDGLFLSVFREVAAEYPEIEPRETLVDALCMGLVQRPEEFDVLVLPNLYGDIISDLTAGLVGGLGVAPGANIGTDAAVFEATHGSAPKYKGQNKVNPTAMILSGKLMLEHIGERDAAARLESAVAAVIAEGENVTYDLKARRDDPTAVGTAEYADAIIDKLTT
jgi:isocitrate dehydrogenase (NAD+)